MKNSKAFYRSALATAIVMALSAPAFAADNAVSTTPVTLDKDKTTLEQDVVINNTADKQITAVTINAADEDLNVTFAGHDITAESTADKEFVEGVKVSGDKNVVINATGSTITAQGEGSYSQTAMVISSTGDVVINGGNFVAKNENGSATGISLEGAKGNNVTLNGTTINAQGNKSSSNASRAIFAQKGSLLQGFNGDATDNITLAGSNIINGRIEAIVIAENNTGTHTVNLNIKDGSVIGAANNKQTIYASASAQGAGSATQNLNLSVADSTIYSDIKALSVSNSSVGTTTNVNMNVARSYWEGNAYADAYGDKASSNLNINLSDGSVWKGNVGKGLDGSARVTLKNSSWDGDVNNAKTAVFLTDGSVWNGAVSINAPVDRASVPMGSVQPNKSSVSLQNGSVWNVTGSSTIDALAVKDSTVNITKATVNTGTFASQNGTLIVDASSENTLDISGKASGDLSVYSAGSLDLINEQTAFISTGKDSTLKATGTTEGGLYQYDLTQGADGNFYFVKNTHKASNASSVIQAMAAAPANVANLQADTLSARQDAVRLSENDKGGVWIQYFGGKQKHTTAGNASYDLDVNGVMLGGDTRFMTEDGSWLAGVAMSSAKGDMTTMQSKGDTEGYSFHAYLSRQYNNGIFIDTAAQFGHYSNTADVRLMNGGGTIKADFNTNGFGAMVKGGYTWKDGNGLFIQPYAKLSALTLEGVDYQLNGVDVHSDSYNSVLGEAGTRVGYDFAVGNATVKPYLNLAALNEFSDGNKVRLGDESVNASIDGAAFRVGAGVQADITKNMGAYASLDYTKGDDIENPLQGVVGINVTW
ncbi:TPA: outer membrane autotransporter HyxB [Escherichia coli]|uniref:outer membrane autotransporter HyxB n=1 Tax=Escherichia coli TaxID=562 RepID=UPI002264B3F3|nr:outer membrane autotransporter HyxB [Escherichia coli]MCX8331380.1 outer membrane autotransporter HyxB [Escherichia coli]MCX8336547.1 outer membrane autotransporter HyxB [Escherichia coli]MCX8353053.1 outer membrane autotransporter HyxB [Escherichia coli]MCX8365495.1 outer membrane autotransporter HyxB [Escherichia coli]MCX8430993.1 outer membrane autotransporter HyxB [Escherichia coli]